MPRFLVGIVALPSCVGLSYLADVLAEEAIESVRKKRQPTASGSWIGFMRWDGVRKPMLVL